jgi:hypothetical protein
MKRLLDLFIAGVGLLAFLPVGLCIAAALPSVVLREQDDASTGGVAAGPGETKLERSGSAPGWRPTLGPTVERHFGRDSS